MSGHLTIYRGLPGSGKTTAARARVDAAPPGTVMRINRDDLRASALPTDYPQPEYAAEELVTVAQQAAITALLKAGVHVLVDDTNLRVKHVRYLAQLALAADATWEVDDTCLHTPVEVCIRRDAKRDHPVGEEVILGMWRRFLSGARTLPVPEPPEQVTGRPYLPLITLPKAVIVDIDGTVALHQDVRGPYDTSRYHLDRPNVAIVEAVRAEAANGLEILFTSGRDEEFIDVTQTWLEQHVISLGMRWQLFMRKQGDRRKDAIVKLELFDQYIRDEYDVRRVYDDRNRVVEAWRSIGLTVLQVAPGAF